MFVHVCVCVCACVCDVICMENLFACFCYLMTGLGYNAPALGFFMSLIVILIIATIVIGISFVTFKKFK